MTDKVKAPAQVQPRVVDTTAAQAPVPASVTRPVRLPADEVPLTNGGIIDRDRLPFHPPAYLFAGLSIGGDNAATCGECGSLVTSVTQDLHTAHHLRLYSLAEYTGMSV